MIDSVYEKLRQARLLKKITLKGLAKECGLSYSYISQVERGEATPSLSSLDRLAKALDTTVWQLLKDENEPSLQGSGNPNPATANSFQSDNHSNHADQVSRKTRPSKVVKKDMRRSIILPKTNVRYEMITPDLNSKIQVIKMEAEAGTDSGNLKLQHEGEECLFVLSGCLETEIGDERFTLEKGDSLYFSSELPHRWTNIGDEKLSVLLVVTPPAY